MTGVLGLAGALVLSGLFLSVGGAQALTPPENRWALLIGIDHFQGATRSNFGAVADVADVREALVRSGWRDDHIRVLTESGAKAADIRAGLAWLVSNSSPTTFSLTWYSGHVQQSGRTEYLWPHDNALIPDTELASSLKALRGRAATFIAGCEAAGFDEGVSSPTHLFVAASQANEKGYEWPAGRVSVFQMYLVRKGMLAGEADFNRDGRVSVQEGFRLAAERSPAFTATQPQGPQHPYIAGGDGKDLFLDDPFPAAVAPAAAAAPARPPFCLLFWCFPI
ncbi:MAG: hypothetical protein QOE93_1836 [Actinomycetota bacterium]|jgi:hypothetical protein|nr:hypothetical protein [Actinomycetota bacterium]